MIDQSTLRQIEEELLFTDNTISSVLDMLGLSDIPEKVEREIFLLICPGCDYWVYRETVRNDLCIDCREAE